MARQLKEGLKYFSFDVDFFDDEKIGAISGEFGIKGEITAINLLCAVYRNGYFAVWNEPLKMKLLKSLPGINSELLDQIVNRLVRWGFFDSSCFSSVKILTSEGIQKRYFEAIKRRKPKEEYPYLLINVDNNAINVCTFVFITRTIIIAIPITSPSIILVDSLIVLTSLNSFSQQMYQKSSRNILRLHCDHLFHFRLP